MMIDKFLKFEYDCGYLNDSTDGFCYWFYIRDKIYSKITNLEVTNTQDGSISHKIDEKFGTHVFELSNSRIRIREIIKVLRNLTIKNPLLICKHKDLLIFPSPRRTQIDGKYYAYWTDEIADYYGDKCLSAEFLNITTHMRPYWNNRVIEMDVIDVYPVLVCMLNKFQMKKARKKFSNVAKNIKDDIKQFFEIDLDIGYLINLLSTRYVWWKYKKRMLMKFISKISPKVILEVAGYSTNCLVINEIATELNILTIELQHGIIGSGHIAYNYNTNKRYSCFPKKLFVFSEYWKQTCSFPIGKENIISVGYPYAEMQKKKYPKVASSNNAIRILVLSQPVFHKEFLSILSQVIDLLEKNNLNFEIIVKLHPTEYNQPSSNWNVIRKKEHVRIIGSPDVALYELLANADIQIGATSTAIYEGLMYNLYTIICKFGDSFERMKDLRCINYVRFAETPESVVDYICKWKPIEKTDVSKVFFVENSIKNICNILDTMIY